MINPRVALLFKSLPANYPRRLQRKHPHILNRLMELWGTPEFEPYIHNLMLDTRGGRYGFSLEVIAELMFIQTLHNIFKSEGYSFPDVVIPEKIIPQAPEQEQEQETELPLPKAAGTWESVQAADPTPQGFQHAIEKGQLDTIRSFLDAGIEVDYRFEEQQTPLILAAINKQLNTVRCLLEHGAEVNLCDVGKYTALHWAAYYRHVNIISILIDAGAEIDVMQKSGDTPLALAVTRGHLDAVKLLLERQADPNVSDGTHLPLAIALRKNNPEMIALLQQFGAHA